MPSPTQNQIMHCVFKQNYQPHPKIYHAKFANKNSYYIQNPITNMHIHGLQINQHYMIGAYHMFS